MSIVTRKRDDGTEAHMVRIRIKREGRIVHSETETFDRITAARQWKRDRLAALSKPGALEEMRSPDPTLGEAIKHYIENITGDIGRTKRQVLNTICRHKIAKMKCSEVKPQDWIEFVDDIGVTPTTASNYLAHAASVYNVAKPAWGIRLEKSVIDDARTVAKRIGKTSRSRQRDRRPTIDELITLLKHFQASYRKRAASPMAVLMMFGLFSTRRLSEITRITFEDLIEHKNADGQTYEVQVWVRDMKHPGEKEGNDVLTSIPWLAWCVLKHWIDNLPEQKRKGAIFPFNPKSISSRFTRVCKLLGIDDLHFHDLRHEGISRLFEMGYQIPIVATVSGHQTWQSLQRYTHIRQVGDKYAALPGFDLLAITHLHRPESHQHVHAIQPARP